MARQYWKHSTSGDVYVVDVQGGKVVAATSDSLYYGDYRKDPDMHDGGNLVDPGEFELDTENAEWINDNADDFRLME